MNWMENGLLRMRALEPEDLAVLYAWENDSRYWEDGNTLTPYSRFQLKNYLQQENDLYAQKQLKLLLENADGIPVGLIDIYDYEPFHQRAQVGLLIAPQWRGKGYATAALKMLCNYAFGFLHLNQLFAVVNKNNTASLQAFVSAGFVQSGVLEQWLRVGDTYCDALLLQRVSKP